MYKAGRGGGETFKHTRSLHHYFYQQRCCQLGREVWKNIKLSTDKRAGVQCQDTVVWYLTNRQLVSADTHVQKEA